MKAETSYTFDLNADDSVWVCPFSGLATPNVALGFVGCRIDFLPAHIPVLEELIRELRAKAITVPEADESQDVVQGMEGK